MNEKLEMPIEDFAIAASKENVRLNAEIERLRAALAHIYAWYPISISQPRKTLDEMREFARAALEGKQ